MSHPAPRLLIDLDAMASNYEAIVDRAPTAEVSAVIKADAYGLGADKVGPVLWDTGCRTFFVATAQEGVSLRQNLGDEPTIYVFEGYWPDKGDIYQGSTLLPVLNSLDQAEAWLAGGDRPTALHLDTGINRLGLSHSDLKTSLEKLRHLNPSLVMSHLACADEPDHAMNEQQRQRFVAMAESFPNARLSLSNTGGVLLGPDYHFDMVRPGIGLYGGHPAKRDHGTFKPVVTLQAPILQIRSIKAGESIGYGATFSARNDMTIATLGIGYADGILRSASNKGHVVYNDQRLPILGKVSMDLLVIDITSLETRLQAGDSVEILGHTLDSFAHASGTISYELLTRLGSRLERTYLS